jgi:uncharacterized protein YjiS (DUF1127 family)
MYPVLGRRESPAAEPGLVRLGHALLRLCRGTAEPWRRRAAIRELQRLNARMLRDAGIEQREIESLVDAMLAARRRIE